MTYIIGNRLRVQDSAAGNAAFDSVFTPKMKALGAVDTINMEWMSGENVGIHTAATEWESLEQAFAAYDSIYADPEVQDVMAQVQPEVLSRVVAVVEAEAGSRTGQWAGLVNFTLDAPDAARLQSTADAVLEAGANGAAMMRAFAGGGATNLFTFSGFFDSPDAFVAATGAMAAVAADNFAAMGGAPIDRLIAKIH